ncbi:hypothetical protein PFISCL1PPCAC_6776, partial [Pristionchus fissidentatus]
SSIMAKTDRAPRPTRREEKKNRVQQLQQEKLQMLQDQFGVSDLGEKLTKMMQLHPELSATTFKSGDVASMSEVELYAQLQELKQQLVGEEQFLLQERLQLLQKKSELQQENMRLLQDRTKMQSDMKCYCCNRTSVEEHSCKPAGNPFLSMNDAELYSYLDDHGYFGLRMENGKEFYREFTKILDFISYDNINPIDNPGAFKNGKFLVEWPDRKEPTWEESVGFWDRGMVGCWEFLEFLIRKQIDERSKEIEEENWRRFEKRIKEEKILRNIHH